MCFAWFWQQFRPGKFEMSVFFVLESSAKDFVLFYVDMKHSTNRRLGKCMNKKLIIVQWVVLSLSHKKLP